LEDNFRRISGSDIFGGGTPVPHNGEGGFVEWWGRRENGVNPKPKCRKTPAGVDRGLRKTRPTLPPSIGKASKKWIWY